jgi:hypothetical protein
VFAKQIALFSAIENFAPEEVGAFSASHQPPVS